MRRYFTGLIFLTLMSACGSVFSQAFSPYSRFGLGYIPQDVPEGTRAMGGFSAGYASAFHINHDNPASYADLALTTFEVGVNADAGSVHTRDSVYNGVNGSVSHVQLGIPLIRGKWGLSFGLQPYSFVNYSFATTQVDTSAVFTGKGSLYQAYIGTAYKFNNITVGNTNLGNLAIGVNGAYMFGSMDYSRGYVFPDSIAAYNIQDLSTTRVYGLVYNVGLQYSKRIMRKTNQNTLKSDVLLTIGLQGNSNMKVGTRVSQMWDRYTGTSPQVIIDTPLNYADHVGKLVLPYNISGGFSLGNESWWIVGVDFKYTGWSVLAGDIDQNQLAIAAGTNWTYGNSWRVTGGGGIVPDYDSRKFFSRIQYKIGAYYGKSEIEYRVSEFATGKPLSEYGATFGVSVPILFSGLYREAAHFHFSADIGARTPGVPGLITENNYRFNFGFTLNNVWFVKRKFD